ncbi:MAG: response regulator [Candidatus Paceibacterota bacterium]|jgi:DNA-binding response OmpR family regulator
MGIFSKFLKKTVLVVEDDPALNRALVDKLSRSGFIVREVQSGNDVIVAVQIHKPDIILLDLMLPGRDGMSILEVLRGADMCFIKPVIILTNLQPDHQLKESAERLNAQFLEKSDTKIGEVVEYVKKLA